MKEYTRSADKNGNEDLEIIFIKIILLLFLINN